MAQPIKELSEQRIGSQWTEGDHRALCRAVDEIERTATAMVQRAMEAPKPAGMQRVGREMAAGGNDGGA